MLTMRNAEISSDRVAGLLLVTTCPGDSPVHRSASDQFTRRGPQPNRIVDDPCDERRRDPPVKVAETALTLDGEEPPPSIPPNLGHHPEVRAVDVNDRHAQAMHGLIDAAAAPRRQAQVDLRIR